jgi:uncharacterized protein (TIGR03435 family)
METKRRVSFVKHFMLWMAALAALPGSAMQGQNITGSWQGTLEAGPQKLRVVFKISVDNDKLKATMYSIDQAAPPMPASTVTKDGSTVKIALAGLGSYEGKLSGDGNSMTGSWTQGPPLPLTLTRATPETAWAIPEPPPPPVKMAANANPVFEVATIKPSEPGRQGKGFTMRGPDVLTINTSLSDLVTMAYDLQSKQVVGLPAWAESDKYDITGRPEIPGQPSVAQMKIMIQKLLVDRFQLKFHREKKELSVYASTVAKAGSKLAKSQADPDSLPGLFFGRAPAGMSFNVRNAPLAEVASVLQGSLLDKPVVDQTGLTGKYDFTLTFTPDAAQMVGFGPAPPAAADTADAPPDLFTAFQQQLGLKLESTKAQADVLVIDKVEKPSAN